MSDINDGGPAFPVMPPDDGEGRGSAVGYPYPDSGMSLRDWFAGMALSGMNASMGSLASWPDFEQRKVMARAAYLQADAMLKFRLPSPPKAEEGT